MEYRRSGGDGKEMTDTSRTWASTSINVPFPDLNAMVSHVGTQASKEADALVRLHQCIDDGILMIDQACTLTDDSGVFRFAATGANEQPQ